MQDFLLELGFEELPARFIEGALKQLSAAILDCLQRERLEHGECREFSTPRRLAVLIEDLQSRQADLSLEVKGPPKNVAYDRQGKLTRAGEGFLRSQGAAPEQLVIKQFQGADYLYLQKEVPGAETCAVLKGHLEGIITQLHFPKNMRWAAYELRYARPLRWVVCLFGEKIIPLQLEAVQAGRLTYGHRQLSAGPLTIERPRDYLSVLENNYVIADASRRKQLISRQIEDLAKKSKAAVPEDPGLLKEVGNLVEYPTAFLGSFSSDFLELPGEVLETSMKTQQRYFPLRDGQGRLLPKFIGIRNGADNQLENVIRGNEKVLAARLSDAQFFFNEDKKISLEDNLPKLERVVFQEGLGSLAAKVQRIGVLSALILDQIKESEQKETVLRTAALAKTDLVSWMVQEFPELQGVMGEKYALLQGERAQVAAGIREHYLPRFAGDGVPETTAGAVVSLADKIDTLAGYFLLGKIPSGSQDPFALRRQAQGIVQILFRRGLDLPLRSLISWAGEGYDFLTAGQAYSRSLWDFIRARLRVLFLDQGYLYDLVDSVLACGEDRLPALAERLGALSDFAVSKKYQDLNTGFERLANLADKGETKELNQALFSPGDQRFYAALEDFCKNSRPKLEEGDYRAYLEDLARFRAPVDQFFEDVMIMDSDAQVRSNRLSMLQKALELYDLYGDFRLIVANK